MTANDYRLLTGACRKGTKRFLEANGYTWENKMTIKDAIEVTKGEYGHELFKECMEK